MEPLPGQPVSVFSVRLLVILVPDSFPVTCILAGNQVLISTCFREKSELLGREDTSGTFALVALLHYLGLLSDVFCTMEGARGQRVGGTSLAFGVLLRCYLLLAWCALLPVHCFPCCM